jgi:hypothetical protein
MPIAQALAKLPNSSDCGRAKAPFWAKSPALFSAVNTRMISGAVQTMPPMASAA